MLKNYSNNDKQISMKLKKILKNKYIHVESNDDTSNQTSNQADFLALRIIDNLIRFNQSFRLSQVAIKANMGKYNKKGGTIPELSESSQKKKQSTEKAKEAKEAEDDEWIKNKLKQYEAEEKANKKSKAQKAIDALLPRNFIAVCHRQQQLITKHRFCHEIQALYEEGYYVYTNLPASSRFVRECYASVTMRQVIASLTRFCGVSLSIQVP